METLRHIGDPIEVQMRAKRRRYVVFQLAGWGSLLCISSVGFLELRWPNLKPDAYPKIHPVEFAASQYVIPMVMGFLLTHFCRRFLTKWGWKQLDWRPLIPRIIVIGLAQTLTMITVVTAVGYFWLHNPDIKPKSVLHFLLFWIGNTPIFTGWLGAYFFYHLFERLNRSENDRLSRVANQKESELRALKTQVNPHFIFNSLNSLRSLIEEEPTRARLAVTQLANLLRYSLQSSQLETVSLEEELRIANDYLALEQVRYEERLRLRIDVAPETLALPVPPMLLQTLVENAIKYGIAQRRDGGEINIIARCVDETLCLQVTNPSAPNASTKIHTESTGTGMRNAAERLRLLFSEHATLQLRTDTPDLVVAEVRIPLKRNQSPSP